MEQKLPFLFLQQLEKLGLIFAKMFFILLLFAWTAVNTNLFFLQTGHKHSLLAELLFSNRQSSSTGCMRVIIIFFTLK